MKAYIYITNIDSFLKGDFHDCFGVFNRDNVGVTDWVLLHEVEIDPTKADIPGMTAKALGIIDKEIESTKAELTTKVQMLETKRQEFLALTHIEGEQT